MNFVCRRINRRGGLAAANRRPDTKRRSGFCDKLDAAALELIKPIFYSACMRAPLQKKMPPRTSVRSFSDDDVRFFRWWISSARALVNYTRSRVSVWARPWCNRSRCQIWPNFHAPRVFSRLGQKVAGSKAFNSIKLNSTQAPISVC